MKYSIEENETYFRKEYDFKVGNGSLLWTALSWWSILPQARIGMKWRGEFPKKFDNWLEYLVAIERSLSRLPGDPDIEGARQTANDGVKQAIEGIKDLHTYYENLRKKKLWPRGHSDIAVNKFLMEAKQIVRYRTGTHRGKVRWGDIKRLASYYLDADPQRFAYLSKISQQSEVSLKSKIRRFEGRNNQRPMYPPTAYFQESSSITAE